MQLSPVKTESQTVTSVVLAVFPFENLSNQEGFDIFCKSFCIDLITELSRFRQFQIIAYQSIKDLQAGAGTEDEQFSRLSTDYFIQGSFRNDKDAVRVNAQLYDSHTHHLVWANRFEGKPHDLIDMQDELLREVVASLQQQLNADLLSRVRKKPRVNLKAYECWLYGIEEVKKGSLESDLKAREFFQRAIEIDPDYSLAYSGMSLTYFNEWSCQLWERWDVSQNGAFEWAEKAIELDDHNYVAALVLGRVFLYNGAYETAEHFLRRSLQLNSNDPDTVIQVASCFLYLGYLDEAYALYEKAIRVNPANSDYYYAIGSFLLVEMGKFEEALSLAQKVRNIPWVDAPVYFGAAHYYTGNIARSKEYWQKFLESYQYKINGGKPATTQEALEWMMKVNPFRNPSRLASFWTYITDGKYTPPRPAAPLAEELQEHSPVFRCKGELWELVYDGKPVQVAEVKGFLDIQKLLQNPGSALHCADLMGTALEEGGERLFDDKAKKSYQKRILELQQEMEQAELEYNNQKLAHAQEEYDKLLDHLSKSLGLKGKVRQTGHPVEKARSAVTWRIRNAISKIENLHPELGRHLSVSIKTGTFCAYNPEKELKWICEP